MRRRDITAGLLLATIVRTVQAQERGKQHRIAIVRPAGPVALINATGISFYQGFFAELVRLGDVEGQNLTVERYSGEGRPESYADLAREVVNRKPDVIIAITSAIAQAIRAATDTVPIVFTSGDPIRAGLVTSLAHPGGNMTGVNVQVDFAIWGKRLQILKEAVPSISKVALLDLRGYWQYDVELLREPARQLQISLVHVVESRTMTEIRRVFAEIGRYPLDAIMVDTLLFTKTADRRAGQ